MNINLNLYKYFYNVAYYGSYTKAAEVLMISQPSLSYSVKVLESQLNKKLFVRRNNKIDLTNYGKYLYDKLDIVFQELETIDIDDNHVSGTVTLGVRSAFAYKVLPFYLSELAKIYPDLRIDFVISKHEKMANLLENDEADLILDEYSSGDEYLSYELEYNYETVFITTKDYFNKNKKIDLNILKKSNICVVETNRVSKEFEKQYPDYKYIKVQSTPIMISRIEKEDMIGIAPLVLVSDELERGNLIRLDIDIRMPKLKLYLLCRKNNKDKNVKLVIDFFKAHFGNYEKSLNNN